MYENLNVCIKRTQDTRQKKGLVWGVVLKTVKSLVGGQ